MKTFVGAVLVALFCLSTATDSSPMVQVYSRIPGEFGKPNTLICHVSGFHPPQITIELQKNGQEIPGATQTDLAFEKTWQYHLTKHVTFTPYQGEHYTCRVTHLGKSLLYIWEPDM